MTVFITLSPLAKVRLGYSESFPNSQEPSQPFLGWVVMAYDEEGRRGGPNFILPASSCMPE